MVTPEGWSRDLPILKGKFDLDNVLFVIGGNLSVGEADSVEMERKYRDYGFDLVFHQIDLNEGLDIVEETLRDGGR